MNGYERVGRENIYYNVDEKNTVCANFEENDDFDNGFYDSANYYSDKTVAKNNARADKLMRQLRRFAVKNNENSPNWGNWGLNKYCINYDYCIKRFNIGTPMYKKDFGQIYFTDKEIAEQAIKTFFNELLWYFTEYCDFVDNNKNEEYGCELCSNNKLSNVGICENRIAVWSCNSKPDKKQQLKFCPNCGRKLED